MDEKQKKDQALKKAYQEVMGTASGQLVLKDMMQKFVTFGNVYAVGNPSENNDKDTAFREGQRLAGSYVFRHMIRANRNIAAQIQVESYENMLKSTDNTSYGNGD